MQYLITRDSKGKIRYIKLILEIINDVYYINRYSGIVDGKEITQPVLIIKDGKAKRTPKEQADLELNSIIRKYKAKGYKDSSEIEGFDQDNITQEYLDSLFPKEVTDEHGNLKVMLAKQSDNLKPAAWKRHWFISTKLDGVRCLMYWDKENQKIKTVSRGGKNYNESAKHILSNKRLINVFKNNPDIVLDGELYHHGISLEVLSGIARLQEWSERCLILQFHCYDLAIPDMDFQHRLEKIDKLRVEFVDEKDIHILEHFDVYGKDEAKIYHDKWVAQGYEGAVLRDPLKEYGFNKRDIRMIKLKEFKDGEFKIVGYKLGLRGSEDMTFTMETDSGVQFEAKPVGDKDLKASYVSNFEKIKDKMGTVKYFYMTDSGKPFLPSFKCIRDYE